MPDFTRLEKTLNHEFRQPELLRQAFIHRSYLNEHPELQLEHNERLEFLGDAVLELVVTEYLYERYPSRAEGELTAYRAALVNADTLSELAVELSFNEYLLLSKGEAKDSGRARQTILANTIEAVIGALHLDGGYAVAQAFIARYLFPKTDSIVEHHRYRDAKSLFQEQAQAKRDITPAYKLLGAIGPDHNKLFTVGLYLGSELVAKGSGPSKQRAEQDAAQSALEKFKWQLPPSRS